MADIKSFQTETEQEKRLHKVEKIDGRPISSIEYINKNYKVPEELIKYYRADEYGYKVLTGSRIWASNPYFHFNDPFDCSIQMWNLEEFPVEFTKNHLQNCGYNVSSDYPPISRKMYFEKMLEMLGIYCLNDNSNSDLFWGYYNDHKGFTITFDSIVLCKFWKMNPLKVEYESVDKFQKLTLEIDEIKNHSFLQKVVRWTTL